MKTGDKLHEPAARIIEAACPLPSLRFILKNETPALLLSSGMAEFTWPAGTFTGSPVNCEKY